MNIREVKSLDELVAAVVDIWQDKPGWLWFRGHRDARWKLQPTVWRDYTVEQERYMSNRFYARARTRYANPPANDDWAGWLSLMQHYGLPTRLLDWSLSPQVAAFFATSKYHDAANIETKAACIWVIDAIKLNKSQGFEAVAPPMNAWMAEPLVRPALQENREGTSPAKVIAAMAVEADPRMQVQQGAFTVHTTQEPLTELSCTDDWLYQFVIPADGARLIAWQLRILGVCEADLFPDLEHLASDLRNEFLPRGKRT
ncbi:MAG: FRG domain-containing protein [Methylococcales bacterium]